MDYAGLRIERRTLPVALWFGFDGELDALNVGAVATVMSAETEGRRSDVYLDLSKLRFISVAGVDMVTALNRRLAVDGRTLHITASSSPVERALDRAAHLPPTSGPSCIATGCSSPPAPTSAFACNRPSGRKERRGISESTITTSIATAPTQAAPAGTAADATPLLRRCERDRRRGNRHRHR